LAFGFAQEFFDGVAGEFGGGRVDEGGFALHVEAVDAFAGGVEDVFVSALECLELLGAGLDVEFEDVFGAFEFLALLGKGFLGLFALVEFGGDSGGASSRRVLKLVLRSVNSASTLRRSLTWVLSSKRSCWTSASAVTPPALGCEPLFVLAPRAVVVLRWANVCGHGQRFGLGSRVRSSRFTCSALPEGCGAEDHTGEAEAGGGGGEGDFFGPGVGMIDECLGAATRAGRPIRVGATASEFVTNGGGGDGGGEFAGFCVEGA
jgi:hypothetical protein